MTAQIIPFPDLQTPALRRLSPLDICILLAMLIGLVAFWTAVWWLL